MRLHSRLMVTAALGTALALPASANDFDTYGQAPPEFVPIQPVSDFVFILGLGIGAAPAYEGASEYKMTFKPIVDVERFRWGFIDVGGEDDRGGFSFSPSVSAEGERISADYSASNGLNNIEASYALGARVGYEFVFNDAISAEIYGAVRYAFGGAQGLIGEVGMDVTAKLSPQLEITGGPVVNFASEEYMDTYFGVTSAESVATGGRLGAFDPTGGIKSVGLQLEARYEFIPDTFVTLNASYSAFVGDARESPIVKSGSEQQFTVGLGLARRFSF
jgi:outer membrane protein